MATRAELQNAGWSYDKSKSTYYRGKGTGKRYTKQEAEKLAGLPTAKERERITKSVSIEQFSAETADDLISRISDRHGILPENILDHKALRDDLHIVALGVYDRNGRVNEEKYNRVIAALRRLTGTGTKQKSWTPFLSP